LHNHWRIRHCNQIIRWKSYVGGVANYDERSGYGQKRNHRIPRILEPHGKKTEGEW